ncbi:MAG: LruC domain-containing protein, partial [Bacteroidales bacterium]|nr:LruC domain-containing protein [Bacteroidales bacterium]
LTYLQNQQTLAKAGGNYNNIASFTESEFTQVMNCQGSSNDPPVAVDDSYSTPMNTPVSGDVSTNDSDPDNDDLTVTTTPVSGPSNGSVILNSDGTFTYTPDNGFTGTDSFDYEICDDGTPSECDEATVTITILAGPNANDDSETTNINTPVDIDVLDNDVAGDGALDPTSVSFVSGTEPPASEGVFAVNGTTGLVTFTPATNYTGTSTIDYEMCDVNSMCDIATITVTITGSLNGPTANDDSETTPINTAVDVDVLDNDVAGDGALDPTTVSFVSGTEPPASEGVFTVNATTGLVTFTPAADYTGTSTIDYEVCDLNSLCDIATITITINGGGGTDTDGDGCTDDVDDYPNDPDRCFDIYYPASGDGTLAYEDLWPGKGDYDFNDLVMDYRFKTVTNSNNKVVEIFGTFTVKAFGAALENGFGFQFPNDNIDQADMTVTGYDLQEGIITLNASGLEDGQSKPTVIVYDNAYNIMEYPGSGIGVNTSPGATYVDPETLNIYIDVVDNKYTYSEVDIPNFNPFIFVDLTRGREVHLPDYPPTDLVDNSYFGTYEDDTDLNTGKYYKTVNNLPWAINIYESFDYPKEKVQVISAYNFFQNWAESNGTTYQDWYQDNPGYRNNSNIYQVP